MATVARTTWRQDPRACIVYIAGILNINPEDMTYKEYRDTMIAVKKNNGPRLLGTEVLIRTMGESSWEPARDKALSA